MQSNEVRIPKNPDFDLSPTAPPCQYFKSSFARSLSLTTSGTKSLDIDINFGLSPFDISSVNDQDDDVTVIINNNNKKYKTNNESPRSLAMSCGSMGAINAARSLLFTHDSTGHENINNNLHHHNGHDKVVPADRQKTATNVWNEKQMFQQQQQQQQHAPEESQVVKLFFCYFLIFIFMYYDVCVCVNVNETWLLDVDHFYSNKSVFCWNSIIFCPLLLLVVIGRCYR